MKTSTARLRSLIVILSLLIFGSSMSAQEKSARFVHIKLPSEPKAVVGDMRHAFVNDGKKVWRIDTDNWTLEEIAEVSADNWFTQIQAITSDANNVYYYVNGQGIYSIPVDGKTSTLIRPISEKKFTRNIEEAYDAMNIDPTGHYLLLYGWKENVAVFDINNNMEPVSVFNDYVKDAYWLDNKLWTATLDKVVINNRRGRSMNNQDFIYYGDNDQHDMTKIYLNKGNILPNMGELEMSIGDDGEVARLLYNKANGDLLLCTSKWPNKSTVYKITSTGAVPVAELPEDCRDFAVYGNKIVGVGRAFIETTYGTSNENNPEFKPIVTDLVPAPSWKGHKPDPLTIHEARYMDFDKDGNLWILTSVGMGGWDLFVMFK